MSEALISALTDQQIYIVSCVMRTTSVLSMLGSSLVIYEVLKLKKRAMAYHLQMLALSCASFIFSTSLFVGNWPPPNSGWCIAKGFFSALSTTPEAMYNACLSLYYLFTLRYHWTDKQFLRLYPLTLLFPIVWGLVCAIIPLVAGMYHSNPLHGCFCAEKYPYGCEGTSCVPHQHFYHMYYFIAINLPRWISFIVAFVALSLVYVALRNDELDCGCEPTIGFLWFVKSSIQTEGGPDDSKLKRSKRMARQGLLYLFSFFMTYIGITVVRGFEATNREAPFGLWIFTMIFLPFQGFWTAIIYMWPRYVHNREKYPNMSRWEAFFSEDNRVDVKSDVQHGDEVESDKDGNEKNQYE